ncbi:MAG: CARDB domain-containing protein [Candidatus Diapherotrites archaeon]
MRKTIVIVFLLALSVLAFAPSSADYNSDSNFSSGVNISGDDSNSADYNHIAAINQPFSGRTSSTDFVTILGYLTSFIANLSNSPPSIVVSPGVYTTIAQPSANFSATISLGTFPAQSCTVERYVQGGFKDVITVYPTNNICYTSITLQENTTAYTIWTAVDTGGQSSNTAQTANVKYETGNPPNPLPDLTIASIKGDWNSDYADVNVVVSNIGGLSAGSFEVSIFEGNVYTPELARVSVSGLAVGQTEQVSFRYFENRVGVHKIIAFADSTNQILEVTKSNNTGENEVQVTDIIVPPQIDLPDLVLGDIAVFVDGNVLTLNVAVRNDGNAGAGVFGVAAKSNNNLGLLLSRQKVNNLSLGASTNVELSFEVDLNAGTPSPGTISFASQEFTLHVFVIADDAGVIPEITKSNNSKIISITLSSEGTIVDQNVECTENCGPSEPGMPAGPEESGAQSGSVLEQIFGKNAGRTGTIYDLLANGINSVFLGAPSILAPWEFLILLLLALIAAYLTFRFSPKVLFEEKLVLEEAEERRLLSIQVFLSIVFFLLPFGVSTLAGFAAGIAWAFLEILFWPLAQYGKRNWTRKKELKSLTVDFEQVSQSAGAQPPLENQI